MKQCLTCSLAVLLLLPLTLLSQHKQLHKNLAFCGYKMKNSKATMAHFQQQLHFLQVNTGDTIVDIGSSSGSVIGLYSMAGDFNGAHFILVDIDTTCLNRRMVNNMLQWYSEQKGSRINNTYELVHNNPDSLYLPLQRFKKVWLFNTLHEIEDMAGIIAQIKNILAPGGELVIAEPTATAKHRIHGGCNKPMLTDAQITSLCIGLGLELSSMENLQWPKIKNKLPLMFYRFVKG